MAKQNGKSVNFLWGALAGGVLGAVSALLLAPKSGRELRKDIADGAQKAGESTVRIAGQAKEKTGEIVQQISTGTSELVSKTKSATGKVIDDVKSWRERRNDNDTDSETDRIEAQSEEQTESVLLESIRS